MTDLLRIITVMRGQWRWLVTGVLLGVAVLAANSLLLALSGWFIASMAVAGASKASFNYFIPAAAIRALAISRTVGRYIERLVTHAAAFRSLAELRIWLFNCLAPRSPAIVERFSAGEVAGRLRADVDSLESLYLRIIAPLATGCIGILLAAAFVAIWDKVGAAVLFVAMALTGVLLPFWAGRLARPHAAAAARLGSELRARAADGIRGGAELLLLGAVDRYVSGTETISAALVSSQERLAARGAMVAAISQLLAGAGTIGVLICAAFLLQTGGIRGAELVMLLLFTAAAFEAVGGMPAAMQHYRLAVEAAGRIVSLAEAPLPVNEPVEPSVIYEDLALSFRDVSFAYEDGVQVLSGFNLEIPVGGRIALTGGSGCGKSTVAALLLRFREYSGSITLGGTELRYLPADKLHQLFAAQLQNPHIFNSTLRDNIVLARPDATAAEIDAVLHDAVLDEWVDGLADGIDTRVGEGGSSISGGEARRLAVARALLKDAPLLILDEPTEGLDTATEQKLLDRLDRCLQGKSLLLITHRSAPLRLVDRVVMMK